MNDYPKLRLSEAISSINRKNRTCGDTEKRNEGNANPFRGDIVVLEILLVIIGGDKGTFGSCRNSVKRTREGKRENENALMSGIDSDLEAVALGTEHAFIPCHPVLLLSEPQSGHQKRNHAVDRQLNSFGPLS